MHDAAWQELTDALVWYLKRSEAAGDGLFAAFRAAIEDVSEFPNLPKLEEGVRKFRVKGYPYFLIVHSESGRILAIAHASREPGYWRDRL